MLLFPHFVQTRAYPLLVALFYQNKNKMAKTIFITGASRGFGKIWAEAFLQRGYNVVATARNLATLADLKQAYGDTLLPIQLDVTDREKSFEAVQQAAEHFGSIDVLINNAGYGLFGAVEEATEQEVRKQFDANVFGLIWVTQAVLPLMRKQGSGHIIQISSVLGVFTLPTLGVYNASKFAVEGLSETLASEVKDFGIHVTLVEPNGFSTEWSSAGIQSPAIAAYDGVKEAFQASFTEGSIGKPEATVGAIVKLVESPNPPLRLFLGKIGLPVAKQVYAERLSTWEAWSDVAVEAHG